jgi:hypothetical protein
MITNLDLITKKTVPSTYSWDQGSPTFDDPSLVDMQIDSEGYLVGYAPFTFVNLSSVSTLQTGDDIITSFKTVSFEDYYNSDGLVLSAFGFDMKFFCHVYVMPGIYDPRMTTVEYTSSADTGRYPKVYFQQESLGDLAEAPVLSYVEGLYRGRIYWNWNKLYCDPPFICDTGLIDAANVPITWAQTKCDQYYAKTWEEVGDTCFEGPPIVTPNNSPSAPTGLPNKIRVKEILPIAYLGVTQPEPLGRISPLSATLTARFTKTGSFPIEKIVWDLGDGSPLLVQRRWAIDTSYPFVYTGAISNDVNDPRNYDINWVYTVDKSYGFSYYPSITAYASSTGTTDCASSIVGPIAPKLYEPAINRTQLLQNNINDQKVFSALFQIEDDIVAAKFTKDPSTNTSLSYNQPETSVVGENSAYVGFGGSTGAVSDEHWIHDFEFSSPFQQISYSELLTNSTLVNNAIITNGSIRLTQATGNQKGNVFLNTPIYFVDNQGNSIDWSAYFAFSIGGGGGADGLSFILQSNTLNSGGFGGGIGYQGIPNSVAVGYDVYYNYQHDNSSNHIQIDVNGNVEASLIQQNVTPSFRGTTGTNSPRYNWIDYINGSLYIYYSSSDVKPASPTLTYNINILNYIII